MIAVAFAVGQLDSLDGSAEKYMNIYISTEPSPQCVFKEIFEVRFFFGCDLYMTGFINCLVNASLAALRFSCFGWCYERSEQ